MTDEMSVRGLPRICGLLTTIHIRIAEIRRHAIDEDDNAAAHIAEDALRDDVLAEIASGELSAQDAAALCTLVRTTSEIEFRRWYS